MDLAEFCRFHLPALATDEIRHNVILSILNRAMNNPECSVRFWSLGEPGVCAVQQSGFGIVLGEVAQLEAAALASALRDHMFPGVVGSDLTACWFVEAANFHGLDFPIMLPRTINVLYRRPMTTSVPGKMRPAILEDAGLVHAWFDAFVREAVPHNNPATREEVEGRIERKHVFLWCRGTGPVAMSCVGRVLQSGVAIAPVYTPPSERCQGYAGAATAAVVDRILEQGYRYVCLNTDDRNPASNRCYEKIGFQPYCRSQHYRQGTPIKHASNS